MNTNDMIFSEDTFDFAEYASEPHDKDKIVAPKAYRDETIALLSGEAMVTGATLPWPKTFDHIRFRPGEVSLWMGINGHASEPEGLHSQLRDEAAFNPCSHVQAGGGITNTHTEIC